MNQDYGGEWIRLVCIAAIIVCGTLGSDSTVTGQSADPAIVHASMGPLTVHRSNPRFFSTPDGRAVWLTGSHTWATLQERGIEGETPDFDYPRYLDFMHRHGHNFLRLWVWEHAQWMQFVDADVPIRYTPSIYQRTGPGNALDGKPKFDLTKFNEAFFRRLRNRVQEAQRRGIYVSVMFFQGFSVKKRPASANSGNNWHGNPFHKANNVNGINGDRSGSDTGHDLHTLADPAVTNLQKAHVRRVIDTLNDFDNVLWEIGNELPMPSKEFQYHMIRFVREYESHKPKQHLIGMTGAPLGTKKLMGSDADWISPAGAIWMGNPPAADGEKVMVVDTDHCRALRYDPDWVWNNLTRGNHFILMDEYLDFRAGSPKTPDPKWDHTRSAMGAARRLCERLDLATLRPQSESASTGFCLADPGHTWVVFQPKARATTVQTGRGRWHVQWIDPVTGVPFGDLEAKAADGAITVTSPRSGATVLLVTKAHR
ncbi:DUF6298 domain-containing protein [Crateriforma spongiae]|uniref:DUF6298 domain-containing protein n=1 Tax=Crateriforma spongiae TaxID=2724528 RepID=UPI0014484977|nr:DUF6298 domain-containing protein [Crateriforma spongiae]